MAGIDILDSLKSHGFITVPYDIDIANPQFNCSPIDPVHPNGFAHSYFAEKLYEKLRLNKF